MKDKLYFAYCWSYCRFYELLSIPFEIGKILSKWLLGIWVVIAGLWKTLELLW